MTPKVSMRKNLLDVSPDSAGSGTRNNFFRLSKEPLVPIRHQHSEVTAIIGAYAAEENNLVKRI